MLLLFSWAPLSQTPLPAPSRCHLPTTNLFSTSILSSFWEYSRNETTEYNLEIFSLSIRSLRSSQAVACYQQLILFFIAEEYSSAWMRQSWFSWMQGRRVIAGILETNDMVLWLREWTVGAEAENCSPITWEVWAEGLSCTQYFTIAQKATMNVCTQILCEHKVSLL